ncbi:MAG: DUF190 domain-containing protein [Sterolibacteriaceae bacterium]|nr:DUF190 domain-containing protein [Sterolibacteriaceae bacterium]MBK9084089.1 DUF190 domain-containing protein [Sterolibacteriaceae bacterium]
MNGTYLKFYMPENRKLHRILAYEWLLEKAKKLGIHGGSAFRAIASFGRHGKLHEDHFFELSGDLTVEVGFALSVAEADRLLKALEAEKFRCFFVKLPVEIGVVNADEEDYRLFGIHRSAT